MDCVFCKIVNKQIPAEILHEDEQILAFKDINPQTPIHILIIPKEHIVSANEITPSNCSVVSHIFEKIPEITKKFQIQDGYRVTTNCGKDAGQVVDHLHFHVLAGRKLNGLLG